VLSFFDYLENTLIKNKMFDAPQSPVNVIGSSPLSVPPVVASPATASNAPPVVPGVSDPGHEGDSKPLKADVGTADNQGAPKKPHKAKSEQHLKKSNETEEKSKESHSKKPFKLHSKSKSSVGHEHGSTDNHK